MHKHLRSVRKINFLTRGKRWDISQKISLHTYHFIKTECGSVISTKYPPLPITSGGLEIPLLLKFSCPEQKMFEKMKNFVDSFYE